MRNASRLPLHLPFSLAALLAALSLLIVHPAGAQTSKVVSSCGSESLTAGRFDYPTMDTTGDACGNGGGGGGGGTSSNFGSVFPTAGTAAGFKNSSSGNMVAGTVDNTSGGLEVDVVAGSAGNGAASNTGSAVPAQAGYTGLNFGGNLKGWVGDTNGYGDVNVENSVAVTGTFWQTTQPVSVASGGIASGAIASGAVASGAYASGSIAAGAEVDIGTGGSPAANTVNARLATINTTLGTPMQASGGTVTVTQATGTNLHAVLDTTSTTAVTQATASNLNMTDVSDVAQGSTTSGQVGPLVQCAVTTSNPTYTNTQTSPLNCTTSGSLRVVIGGSGTSSGSTMGTVYPGILTTGGWTPKLLNALTNTAVAVKAAAGQLGMLQCYNPNSSQVYIQIYNIAQGSVTVGTSTPLESIAIAPTSTGGFAMSFPGHQFGTAITVAATTTATGGSAPSTAPDCNAVYN
jgi:hypothetical protein